MQFKVRNATIHDAEKLGEVHVRCWQETYPGFIPQKFLDDMKPERGATLWRESLTKVEECEWTWIAENEEGEVIGLCSGGEPRDELGDYDCELQAIYLLGDYHKRGIGKALFRSMKDKAIQQKKNKMYLWVLEGNPTCQFYESQGGVRTSHTKVELIDGEPAPHIMYQFDL